jgi:hypothetical protein
MGDPRQGDSSTRPRRAHRKQVRARGGHLRGRRRRRTADPGGAPEECEANRVPAWPVAVSDDLRVGRARRPETSRTRSVPSPARGGDLGQAGDERRAAAPASEGDGLMAIDARAYVAVDHHASRRGVGLAELPLATPAPSAVASVHWCRWPRRVGRPGLRRRRLSAPRRARSHVTGRGGRPAGHRQRRRRPVLGAVYLVTAATTSPDRTRAEVRVADRRSVGPRALHR